MQRDAVAHLQAVVGLSERRACNIVGADRKMVRYRSCRPPVARLANERRRFGYRLGQLRAARRFAPPLTLRGDVDRAMPVSNADAIETLLQARGGIVERRIYPGQCHSFDGAAFTVSATGTATFLGRCIG